jgi:NAD(P)-dependent dehydrogenase (short-subunit alcohol dehydrogenase family)
MGGKTVLITGGTSGIGKAKVAYDLAARRTLWEISEDLTGLKVAA